MRNYLFNKLSLVDTAIQYTYDAAYEDAHMGPSESPNESYLMALRCLSAYRRELANELMLDQSEELLAKVHAITEQAVEREAQIINWTMEFTKEYQNG